MKPTPTLVAIFAAAVTSSAVAKKDKDNVVTADPKLDELTAKTFPSYEPTGPWPTYAPTADEEVSNFFYCSCRSSVLSTMHLTF